MRWWQQSFSRDRLFMIQPIDLGEFRQSHQANDGGPLFLVGPVGCPANDDGIGFGVLDLDYIAVRVWHVVQRKVRVRPAARC